MFRLDDIDFLNFDDYITKQPDRNEWIIITRRLLSNQIIQQSIYQIQEKWSTISAVMRNNKEYLQKIETKYDWEIEWMFVNTYTKTENDCIEFDNDKIEQLGIEIAPFIFEKHAVDECNFTIHPDFIKYYKLTMDGSQNYVDVNKITVVKFVKSNHIEIKSEYLRDYLYARNLVLVRYHEHNRSINKPAIQIIGKERESKVFKPSGWSIVFISIGTAMMDSNRTVSMLRGKDIVFPQMRLTK